MKTLSKLLIVFVMSVLTTSMAIAQNNGKQPSKVGSISINNFSGSLEISEGFWTATKEKNTVHIQLMNSRKTNGSFFINFTVDETELTKNDATSFELDRQVGKITFKGQFPIGESTGKFLFVQHADFKGFLKGKVLTNLSKKEDYYYFKLFLGNVTKSYVNNIIKRGYKPTLKQLGKLAIHNVSTAYMDALDKTNYRDLELDMLVRFAQHDVTINYLKELDKAGYGYIDAQMVKRFAIHGVSSNYIKELAAVGYGNLEANMLKKFATHKISSNYIKSLLATNIYKPDANDIKKAKIHKISASFIKDAQNKGYDSQELAYYVKLKVRGKHKSKSKYKI